MIIEVGKAYKTRDGRKAIVTGHEPGHVFYIWDGKVGSVATSWDADGFELMPSERSARDLISPWDQPSSNIAERKMDVNVGDRVLIEAVVNHVVNGGTRFDAEVNGEKWCALPTVAIKSVEPAPPAVGDTIMLEGSPREWEIIGVDGKHLWIKYGNDRMQAGTDWTGFRIVKRREKK